METKICFKCGLPKSINDFYKHSGMADGHLNKCKNCTKKDVSVFYNENKKNPLFIEKERRRGRDKFRRLYAGVVVNNDYARTVKYRKKYPEKELAKRMSRKLNKPFKDAEPHHWSYNESHYQDVIWLNKKQHMKSHRFIVYDQERKMYRRYDTNELLDTKEMHKVFIEDCIKNKED